MSDTPDDQPAGSQPAAAAELSGHGSAEPTPVGEPAGPAGARADRTIQYKGAPLDAERGPGLGCFRIQLVVLAIAVVLTPLSVAWSWPESVSAALLFLVILLLLVTGQTIIFLLRLVAADRRASGRRRPLASATKTVGEIEDERHRTVPGSLDGQPKADSPDTSAPPVPGKAPDGEGPVRQ